MKQFGRSMLGLDRIVSDTLFLATEGRLPRLHERRQLVARIEAPAAACVDVHGVVDTASGILPIAAQILGEPGTKILFEMVSFVLKNRGGKKKEADAHLMEAYRLMMEDRASERKAVLHNEEQWRAYNLELADKLSWHAREAVAPVGKSSETMMLRGPHGVEPTVIDVPMAEAIRSNEPLEVGDMTKMRVRVDGVIKHSRLLKVEIEEEPGRFVTAEVRDPAFDTTPNIYLDAIRSEDFLIVDAKPTYKNGELVKLHIMDAA